MDYYREMMRSEKDPPRALAYHMYGFMNLLLDGHHKACAAASLGKCVRCLTIIPWDGIHYVENTVLRGVNFKVSNPQVKTLLFAGLKADVDEEIHYLDVHKEPEATSNLSFKRYTLTDTVIHYGPAEYPTVRDLAIILEVGDKVKGLLPEFDPDVISRLNYEDTDIADSYLEAILRFVSFVDQKSAYKLASLIVKKGDGYMRHRRVRAALLYLLNFRSDETEQLFVDFYLNHEEHDENWEIANSYWKNSK